jgi:hypothetical protein
MSDNHEVEIALAEYQACSDTRNHYDNIRWTIGSVFVAFSLALFGLSFSDSLGDQLVAATVFMFLFSLSLIVVWYLYFQHVNPYVLFAVVRAHEIEKYLSKYPNGPKLNKKIWEEEKKITHIRGVTITLWLFVSTVLLWMLRIMGAVYIYFKNFTSDCLVWFMIIGIIFGLIIFLFFLAHKMLNSIKINEKIEEVWKSGEKAAPD